MQSSGPHHHLSLRKRIFRNLEQYPHSDRLKRLVDEAAYVVGIVTPLFSIPQLYEIWHNHSAVGVSLSTWTVFTLSSVFWLFYGILHGERPIIISQILWFFLQLAIVVGIVIYR